MRSSSSASAAARLSVVAMAAAAVLMLAHSADAQPTCFYNYSAIANASAPANAFFLPPYVCQQTQAAGSSCRPDCKYGFQRQGDDTLQCSNTTGVLSGTFSCVPINFIPYNISSMPGDDNSQTVRFGGDATYPASDSRGLVGLYYNGWGSMCRDYAIDNNIVADMVCRALGWHTRVPAGMFFQPYFVGPPLPMFYGGTLFGDDNFSILLDDVQCHGGGWEGPNNTNIDRCMHRPWRVSNCDHSTDFTVSCLDNVERTLTVIGKDDSKPIVRGDSSPPWRLLMSPGVVSGVYRALSISFICLAGTMTSTSIAIGSNTSTPFVYTAFKDPFFAFNGREICTLTYSDTYAIQDFRPLRLNFITFDVIRPAMSATLDGATIPPTGTTVFTNSQHTLSLFTNGPILNGIYFGVTCVNSTTVPKASVGTLTLGVSGMLFIAAGNNNVSVTYTAPATPYPFVRCTFKFESGDTRFLPLTATLDFAVVPGGPAVVGSTGGSSNPGSTTGRDGAAVARAGISVFAAAAAIIAMMALGLTY